MQRFSPKPRTPNLQIRDLLRAEIRSSKPRFWRHLRKHSLPRIPEVVEATAVLVAVVGFGLGWALWIEPPSLEMQDSQPASLSGTAYPDPAMTTPESRSDTSHDPATPTDPRVDEWLVDGFNLLHAALLGGEEGVDKRIRDLVEGDAGASWWPWRRPHSKRNATGCGSSSTAAGRPPHLPRMGARPTGCSPCSLHQPMNGWSAE